MTSTTYCDVITTNFLPLGFRGSKIRKFDFDYFGYLLNYIRVKSRDHVGLDDLDKTHKFQGCDPRLGQSRRELLKG